MKIGILGFEKSGKTTVFNALTGSHVPTMAYGGGKAKPHIAVVKVPDERVDRLAELIQPKKVVYATVEYVDLGGIERSGVEKGKGLGEAQLQALANTDALLSVIRAFQDKSSIPVDVTGDVEAINLELILSDLAKIENRIPKLEKLVHKVSGEEREHDKLELSVLEKIKEPLERGEPLRSLELSSGEKKAVRGFSFLTEKPTLFVINVGEEALAQGEDLLSAYTLPEERKDMRFAAMCAEIEAEIAQLSPEEREAFLEDYGITQPSTERIVRLCYDLLGYISFFTTVGEKEVHSWTIKKGTTALKAAGAVHSDFEHGFIRAEVIRWDKLLEAGSFSKAKKMAILQLEGKEYEVKDGDVINFLFSA